MKINNSIVSFLLILCFFTQQITFVMANLKNVGIYYGWPSSFNSATNGWNLDSVAAEMSLYGVIVLGAGLEKASHPDHANTGTIISKINPSVEVFGYIDIGNTNSRSMADMKTSTDEWKALGIDGILLDQFGFDYWSSDSAMRSRQKQIMDYVHSKNLKTIMNAWNPRDVFVLQSSNPLPLTSNDYYLWESYVFSFATPLSYLNHMEKYKAVLSGNKLYGVKTLGVSTTAASSGTFNQSNFDFMVLSAKLDGLAGVGWGVKDFGSDGVMPFRAIKPNLNAILLQGVNTYYRVPQRTQRKSNTVSKIVKLFFKTHTYTL